MTRVSTYPQAHCPASQASNDELIARWQEHRDRQARDELFERYRPLVRKLAGRYLNPHEPLEDLVQVGSIGLLGALDRFDPQQGTRFISFAIPTILGELRRYFRDTGWAVHVPRGAQEMALRVDRAVKEMTPPAGGGSPTVEAIAEYLELSMEDVLVGLDARNAHFSSSLDAPVTGRGDEEDRVVRDSFGIEDERFALVETKLSYAAAIARLPYAERQAVNLRIEHDLKQSDIANRMGCSQMQVSRLLRRAGETCRQLIDPDLRRSARM
jgi:RNA polymerase sigma-B factor